MLQTPTTDFSWHSHAPWYTVLKSAALWSGGRELNFHAPGIFSVPICVSGKPSLFSIPAPNHGCCNCCVEKDSRQETSGLCLLSRGTEQVRAGARVLFFFYFLLIIMINIMATPCIEGIKTQSFPKSMTQPLHSQLSVRFLGKNFRSFFCTAPYLPKKLSALSVPRVGGRGSTQSHTCRWVS